MNNSYWKPCLRANITVIRSQTRWHLRVNHYSKVLHLIKRATVTWLKYFRYGVKLYQINQSVDQNGQLRDRFINYAPPPSHCYSTQTSTKKVTVSCFRSMVRFLGRRSLMLLLIFTSRGNMKKMSNPAVTRHTEMATDTYRHLLGKQVRI